MPYDQASLDQIANINRDKQITALQAEVSDILNKISSIMAVFAEESNFMTKFKLLDNRLTTLEARLNTPKIDTVVQAKATTSKFKFW